MSMLNVEEMGGSRQTTGCARWHVIVIGCVLLSITRLAAGQGWSVARQVREPVERTGNDELNVRSDNMTTAQATAISPNVSAEQKETVPTLATPVPLRTRSEIGGDPEDAAVEAPLVSSAPQRLRDLSAIPQASWTLHFVDSTETANFNGMGTNAFDGNPNTSWVTQYSNGGPPLPHEIQIDLGSVHHVGGFRYLPHQAFQGGRFGDYAFYVSVDGAAWGAPVAVGSFPDTNSGAARDVLFPTTTGRYVRFRALSEVNAGLYTFSALAELNVFSVAAGANQPPVAVMTSPSSNLTLVAGSPLPLIGSGADADGHLPLTHRWSVGPGSGITDLAAAQPGVVQFDRAGTFPVTLTTSDSLGKTTSVTRTVTVVAGTPISNSGWALRFADSEDTAGGNVAINAFDGDSNTTWMTESVAAQPPPPHEIQIDLGATRAVRGFRYLPRQDGSVVGNIGRYRFFVSSDGLNWGAPVASGTFDMTSAEKEIATAAKSGRYVRLQALSEINGQPFTAVAELQILAPTCQGLSVTLGRPLSRQIQTSTTLAVQADACLGAGQGVRFVVEGVTVGDDYTAPYGGSFSGLSQLEHAVEAFAINGAGVHVGGAATYDVATRVGIGGYYVATGDGMTVGFGDDRPSDDNSADGRNLFGGYTPILADGLTAARGYPVAVVNEGVSGSASINGATAIHALLQQHPEAQYYLVLYGHNDAEDGVPSGSGLSPGQPGYAGSFKDRIQQIIAAVNASGKRTILAKAPPILPVNGAWDTFVQQYNAVMDQLAAIPGNLVPVPPIDFYTPFLSRTQTEYADNLLLNGLGYRTMAQLWLEALD